jgi:octaprenyl-diphosphate synthase
MGGIKYTREKMQEFKTEAIEGLRDFPESAARDAMVDLVEFTVSRSK